MAAKKNLSTLLGKVLDGRNGGTDTGIISDAEGVVKGHIQIRPNEHSLSFEVSFGQVSHTLLRHCHNTSTAFAALRDGSSYSGDNVVFDFKYVGELLGGASSRDKAIVGEQLGSGSSTLH